MDNETLEIARESAFATHLLNALKPFSGIRPDGIDKIELHYACDDTIALRSACKNAIESGDHSQIAHFPKSGGTKTSIICAKIAAGEKQFWCIFIDSEELYENIYAYATWDNSAKKWMDTKSRSA